MIRRQNARPLLALGLLMAAGAAGGRADEPPPWHPCRIREWPGRLYYGRGGGVHSFDRAGYPNETSRFAHPSNTHRYYGYYVGGGVLRNGIELGPPTQLGTWGWDYGGLGCLIKPIIALKWNPARYQSGYGAYRVDGPPVPDVGPYVERLKEGPTAIHEIKGKE